MNGKPAQPNWVRTGLIVVVGGGAMIVAAQMLAKPNQTKVVQAVTRTGRDAPRASARAANSDLPSVQVNPAPDRPALAGDPPIREFFRPLVTPPKRANAFEKPKTPTPPPITLPPVTTAPTTTPVNTSASAQVVPTVEMLGVVELDDEVQVLLKNTTTGERKYFSKGEDAWGFKISEIKDGEVGLDKGGKPQMVAMSTMAIVEGAVGAAPPAGPGGFGPGFGAGGPGQNPFGGRGGRGGRDGGGRDGGRGGRDGGGRDGGGESSGFTTASIMGEPTWAARLKKLEESKSQMEPARYDRLKKFISDRAAAEKK